LLPHFRPGRGLCDRPCDNCILSIGLEPWQKPPNPATFLSGKLMRPSGRAPPGVHIRRPIHGLQISNLCSISARSGPWAWPPSSLMAYLVNGKARCRAPDCTRPYRRCCWYRGCSKEDLHREAFPFTTSWAYRKLPVMRWNIELWPSVGGLIHFLALLFLPLSINILFDARKNHLAIMFLISRIVITKTNGTAIIQKKPSL
jgi:hypothetical protein